MELTITEVPFKETIEDLDEVGDGYYYGTAAFKNDDITEKSEMLTWKAARLYYFSNETKSKECWVVIRPDPIFSDLKKGKDLWYFCNWSGSTMEGEVTKITVTMHGDRNLFRYTGIERADGFNDRVGFDELIDALTCVKQSFELYDADIK